MAHRQEEAENHWPGFVDALSTIVMVVTFLLIILGVVIFIIAQQIKTSVGNSSQKSEMSEQYFKPAIPENIEQSQEASQNPETIKAMIEQAKATAAQAKAAQAESEAARAEAEAAQAESEAAQAESQAAQAESEAAQAESEVTEAEVEAAQAESEAAQAESEAAQAESEAAQAEAEAAQAAAQLESQKIAAQQLADQAKITLAEELRQDRETELEINGQKVISQQVDESQQITIASEDTPQDLKANIVRSADAILTLIFDQKSVTIDENSKLEIEKFLDQENIIDQPGQIEIRSYVNLNQASMGEARRKAFYRAMAARNILLNTQIKPKQISLKVIEIDDEKLSGIVKIYIKP